LEKKEACPCMIRTPISVIAMITTIILGVVTGFNPLTYMVIFISFIAALGSALAPRIEYSGGVTYLIGYLGLFALFDKFNIVDIFNIGLENLSIFGALLAIALMFMKKSNPIITIYIIGLGMFFMTGVTSGLLPIIVGTLLWIMSEIIIIYSDEYLEVVNPLYTKFTYFSAALFSYGVLMFPLALL
jgi:hypothetical protein